MSDIHHRVAEILAERYLDSDAPHGIMDNPVFNQLPMESRVELLKKHKDVLGERRHMSSADVSNMLGWGALWGAGTLAGTAWTYNKRLPLKAYALAAAVGGTLGAAVPLYIHKGNIARDNSSAEDILENRYLDAIATRSMSTKKPVPPSVDPKALVGVLNNNIISNIYKSYSK